MNKIFKEKIFIDLPKERVSIHRFLVFKVKVKIFLLLSDCLLDMCLFSLEYESLVCGKCNFVLL